MSINAILLLSALCGFALLLGSMEVGRRLGLAHLARDPEGGKAGHGAVEGTIYGLLGLLVAFSFSGAASRFNDRRHLVVEHANAIGTAYLRLDLLAPEARASLQDKFRRALDSRIEAYRKLPDIDAAEAELARASALHMEIWAEAVAACKSLPGPATGLVLGSLNQMIDVSAEETAATRMHPPLAVFGMLGTLALAGALLTGYSMAAGKSRSRPHMVAYAAVMAIVLYIIVDLELPRLGLIRVDDADQLLVQLRQEMK